MNEQKLVIPSTNVTESDRKNLENAQKLERRLARSGWRWKSVNGRTSVFVPCDSEGNPTARGLRILDKIKSQS